ncbi:MAG: acyltransferase, partial [Bacilli bacterium]|nr:acyltransferase [Bacilli bacterium]
MDALKIKLYRSRHGGRWDNEYLRKKGMKIGKNVQIYADKIDLPYAALFEIGDDVIVSTASLMAHDASTKLISDYVKIARVKIGSRVFIGHSA